MKKEYIAPEIEVIVLETQDVITVSVPDGEGELNG